MSRAKFILFVSLLLILVAPGEAAPSAVATLSRKEVMLGEEVELAVRIEGGSNVSWSGALQVEGLAISAPHSEIGFGNFFGGGGRLGGGSGITLSFTITPQREGDFTIPPIQLAVDGRAVRTEPVALKVLPEGAGGQKKANQPTLGLLEIVLKEQPFYVGQLIPLEIWLSGAAGMRWQPEAMPELKGDGFTKVKFPEPRQKQGEKEGEALDVYVFRTAIMPSRAGKLELGPVEAPYAAVIPRARARRPRSFFDDIFQDPAFGQTQHFKAQAPARVLDVKPLPTTGRPESFSGGIGKFEFSAQGTPVRVKAGDPVTMKLTVKGRGNFDRVSAPVLKNAPGWRTYPPSAEFKASDDLGLEGTKTFSLAVIPETKQTAMPVFEFCYFDPAKGSYVTLQSEPQPLTVEGGAPLPPVAATAPPATAEPAPATPAPVAPSDILGLRYDAGRTVPTFEPLYMQRGFWAAQAVPALGLMAWLLSRRKPTSAEEIQRRRWRKEKAELLAKLRGSADDAAEFLERAAHVIRLETAIATGQEAASIDALAALASRSVDEETAAGVERLFSARAQLLYAGGAGGVHLSADDQRAILASIDRFSKAHARR